MLCSVAKIGLVDLVSALTMLAALTGPVYSYKVISYAFFDNTRSHKSVLLAPGRDELASVHNTNTPTLG